MSSTGSYIDPLVDSENFENSYNDLMNTFCSLGRTWNDIFYEILIESPDSKVGVVKSVIIKPKETGDDESTLDKDYQEGPQTSAAALSKRFAEFRKTKDSFKLLLEQAIKTQQQLQDEYKEQNYRITLVKREFFRKVKTE